MKSVIFISDFFVDEVRGGGELVDNHLIDLLSTRKVKIEKIKSVNVTESFIKSNSDKIYVISNFTLLPPRCKTLLQTVKYFIFEHDHKYTMDRDVSLYKDYIVPPERLVNLSFYQNEVKEINY